MHHEPSYKKRTPLWKWLVIILLVISIPFFFQSYRYSQTQKALQQTNQ